MRRQEYHGAGEWFDVLPSLWSYLAAKGKGDAMSTQEPLSERLTRIVEQQERDERIDREHIAGDVLDDQLAAAEGRTEGDEDTESRECIE